MPRSPWLLDNSRRRQVMASVKESLHEAVGLLTEDQARQVLGLVERMIEPPLEQDALTRRGVLDRLAGDPSFTLPAPDAGPFEDFEPIEIRGTPASQLLMADRR